MVVIVINVFGLIVGDAVLGFKMGVNVDGCMAGGVVVGSVSITKS